MQIFQKFQSLSLDFNEMKTIYFICSNVKSKTKNISLIKSTQKRYNRKQINCTENLHSTYLSLKLMQGIDMYNRGLIHPTKVENNIHVNVKNVHFQTVC